jgi:hypothetical protein
VLKGYRVVKGDRGSYLVRVKPDFTAADIERIEWRPGAEYVERRPAEQYQNRTNEVSGGPELLIFFRPYDEFRRLTGQNIGHSFLVMAGGRVLFEPVIRLAIPGQVMLPYSALGEPERRALAPYLKGLPGTAGLVAAAGGPVGEPAKVPGTATIAVTARLASGARPMGAACTFEPSADVGQWPLYPTVTPTVVGGDGDWEVYNVAPGRWALRVSGGGASYTADNVREPIEVRSRGGENLSFRLTLQPGGTVTGRVVRADTGRPVAGAVVAVRSTTRAMARAVTSDAQGRYVLEHVAAGPTTLVVFPKVLVPVVTDVGTVKDEQVLAAPDIRLPAGGWVSGRIARPADVPQGYRFVGKVTAHLEGASQEDEWARGGAINNDLTFRSNALPPGVYTLKARLGGHELQKFPRLRWEGVVSGVRVQVGTETKGLVLLDHYARLADEWDPVVRRHIDE